MITERALTAPTTPSELTPAWLTQTLRAAGALGPSAAVAGFSACPIGEGVGLLGSLVRLALDFTSASPGAPATLVAKFSTANAENRAVAMAFGVYAREVGFYRHVAPGLPGASPRCYAAEYDAASGASLLLLEDLDGYRMGDQETGCGAAEAELLIDLLAPMHARYWGQADEPALAWAPRIDGPMQLEGFAQGCAAGWDPCATRFGHVIAPEILAQRERFIAAMPELSRRMARPPQTLVHGDLRLDNLMFGVRADQRPAVAIDWIVSFSAGVHDLAYLLSQNLRIDERRAHEHRLVARYQRKLSALGVAGYGPEAAWADYLAASLYMFSYGVVIAGTLDPTNPRAMRMMEQLMARASATVMDHGLLARLPA